MKELVLSAIVTDIMGKSYKQNDRHFHKNGRSFSKMNKLKSEKHNNFDKHKGIFNHSQKDDPYDDMKGLS